MSDPAKKILWRKFPGNGTGEASGSGGHGNPPLPPGGDGGDNGGMETRVNKLESAMISVNDRLTKIETRLEHMPTKADLSEVMNAQIKWIVGTAVVLGVAALTIMTFVLNNAVPRQPSSQAAPTVIVNVPPQQAPTVQQAAPPPTTKAE